MTFAKDGSGTPHHTTSSEWLAVASVALGTFALVTSEFLPVGLLTKVAVSLRVSDGLTGLMVTTPGIVAAIAAPAVMMGAGKLDRRIILWILSAILVVSNLTVALAPNLPILLLGRVMLGIDVGAFWAISSVIATKMVAPSSVSRANAIIFAGISVGTVVGVPAGALIGDAFGWRAGLWRHRRIRLAGPGRAVAVPHRLPPSEIVSLRHLTALFGIPKARLGLLATMLAIIGQFGAYTYMGAFLEQVTLAPPALLSALLLGYGIAGFIGNFLGGAAVERNARRTLAGTALLLGASIVLLRAIGWLKVLVAALVILWGLAFGALPIAMQGWMLKAAPDEMESASAMFISVLQVGLASGALLGGVVLIILVWMRPLPVPAAWHLSPPASCGFLGGTGRLMSRKVPNRNLAAASAPAGSLVSLVSLVPLVRKCIFRAYPGQRHPQYRKDPTMARAMKIDFVSDVSCPWCVIGLRGLEQALARTGDVDRCRDPLPALRTQSRHAARGAEHRRAYHSEIRLDPRPIRRQSRDDPGPCGCSWLHHGNVGPEPHLQHLRRAPPAALGRIGRAADGAEARAVRRLFYPEAKVRRP